MKNQYISPIRALINLNSLKHNINIVRMMFPNAKIILPVKANAYGHGDLIISKEAEKLGKLLVIEGYNLMHGGGKIGLVFFIPTKDKVIAAF